MKYVFEGPVPVPNETGELLHPLDVREFGEAPDCPPWRLADEPAAREAGPLSEDPPLAPQAPPAETAQPASPKGK